MGSLALLGLDDIALPRVTLLVVEIKAVSALNPGLSRDYEARSRAYISRNSASVAKSRD